MKNWLIYFMLIFATSSWGSAFIAGKFAVESFGPSTVAFLRFFGAMILLFPIMWIFDKNRPNITTKDWGLFALLGLTGIAIYNICFFLASVYAPVKKVRLSLWQHFYWMNHYKWLILSVHCSYCSEFISAQKRKLLAINSIHTVTK